MRPSALVLFMVFGCSGGISAQETEIAQLNARVRVLEERLAEVEAKLAAVEVRPHGVQGGAPRSSSEATPPVTPKPSVAPPGNAAVDQEIRNRDVLSNNPAAAPRIDNIPAFGTL